MNQVWLTSNKTGNIIYKRRKRLCGVYKLCKVFFTSYGTNFTTYMKAIYKYNTIFYTEIVDKDNENMKGKGKRNEGYIQQTDRTEKTDPETIIR